jgi:hypothetical protein
MTKPFVRADSMDGILPRIPTEFNHSAQGSRFAPTLGQKSNKPINPERVESKHRIPHHSVVPQSLAKILVHTFFSAKDRRPFLRDKRCAMNCTVTLAAS